MICKINRNYVKTIETNKYNYLGERCYRKTKQKHCTDNYKIKFH